MGKTVNANWTRYLQLFSIHDIVEVGLAVAGDVPMEYISCNIIMQPLSQLGYITTYSISFNICSRDFTFDGDIAPRRTVISSSLQIGVKCDFKGAIRLVSRFRYLHIIICLSY